MTDNQPLPNWAIETLVPEEVYTDREDFLAYFFSAALKARTRRTGSKVLLGQRRMGKTEIFKRVVNRLFFEQDHRDPKAVVPVYYSFSETFQDRWDFAAKYVENVIRWYVAFRLRNVDILSKRKVQVPQLTEIVHNNLIMTDGFEGSLEFLDSLFNQKNVIVPEQVALDYPRQVAADENSTIVMFLDEFQNTRLPHYDFDVVGYMQEAVESPTCPHFVTGSAMSILAREILGRGSLFGRFESDPIEPLTEYWGAELVRKAANYYQAVVSEEMTPIIASRCGGNPFYITSVIKQAVKLDKTISDENSLNEILAVDLSSGFIWGELSDQVERWIERINEHGTQIKMVPMYHWASRRIVSHVKICVLALLIERIAEMTCGMSWHHIQRNLETLQITEFFDLKYRVLMRNEVTTEARNILKSLKIKVPKQLIHAEKTA
jgi:AAA+ ATPase superfamily predicted ATPase